MIKPLSQRAALVTGASSGIGEGIALALAEAGVKVMITARRADRLDELVARIRDAGGEADAIPGDITDEAFARDAVARTADHYGSIDILVNNAGTVQAGGVENCDTQQWREVMDLNFFAALYTSTAVIPFMKEQGGGDIVQISSTAGRRITPNFGSYGPSKHALNAMSGAMRTELGEYGIRVCIIEPGATTSEVSESMTDPKARDFMRRHIGKEGAMKPVDIAAVTLCVLALPARANVQEILIRPTIDVSPM